MESVVELFWAPREWQGLLREVGLVEIEQVFSDPRIVVWRSIPERENGVLDATLADGREVRLHIKRYRPVKRGKPPGEVEADGILALEAANIPTVALVAWGKVADGRSFVISLDLEGYEAADKLVERGLDFERLLGPTADLTAKLHEAGLHHRDLYLCHFFVRVGEGRGEEEGQRLDGEGAGDAVSAGGVEVRLIDAARVGWLPKWPLRRRWVVKDLGQFWYSAMGVGVGEAQRVRWVERYARQRGVAGVERLLRQVRRKAEWIARHDAKLRAKQPGRNISIPGA